MTLTQLCKAAPLVFILFPLCCGFNTGFVFYRSPGLKLDTIDGVSIVKADLQTPSNNVEFTLQTNEQTKATHDLVQTDNDTLVSTLPRLVPQLPIPPILDFRRPALSKDGPIVAVPTSGAGIYLANGTSGMMFRHITDADGNAVDFSKDGARVLSSFGGNLGVWDVASGELLQKFKPMPFGPEFFAFLYDDARILACYDLVNECHIYDGISYSQYEKYKFDLMPKGYFVSNYSLAPDGLSIAFVVKHLENRDFIGWLELSPNRRQRLIPLPVPDSVNVSAVAALGSGRVVAGVGNGDVMLIDVVRGKTLNSRHLSGRGFNDVVRLDDERLAVTLFTDWERNDCWVSALLIISVSDFSVLQHLNGYQTGCYSIGLLAASDDGHWLISHREELTSKDNRYFDVWNTARVSLLQARKSSQNPVTLGTNTLHLSGVRFNGRGDWLLVSDSSTGLIFHLDTGRVTRPFRYVPEEVTLTHDTLVYVDTTGVTKIWSDRSGIRDLTIPAGMVEQFESPSHPISVDGTHVAIGVETQSYDNIMSEINAFLLLSINDTEKLEQRFNRLGLKSFQLDTLNDRILLQYTGIEMFSTSKAEPIWLRYDLGYPTTVHDFTVDRTGVVIGSQGGLFVLDSESGETRFNIIAQSVSSDDFAIVFSDIGIQGILMVDDSRVSRLSLRDGSVISSDNIDISSLYYAVSNHTGDNHLVVDRDGRAVFWDTTSGKYTTVDTKPRSPSSDLLGKAEESIAFSSDGRLLTIAKLQGTVELWDVSRGPSDLRLLANLLTTVDGFWAVVAPDGRYDASDPADSDGLAWVMPDAPTKPVPLSIFYREYYEPRLLPRLLAGEVFPPIATIADLDRTQPLVEITTIVPAGANHVNVSVEVKETGAEGAQDLKLFRDGRLVGLDSLAGHPSDLSRGDTLNVTFERVQLPTSGPDRIEFSAYAFNGDGIKSETHRLAYTRPSVEPNPRRAFVIVVGVNAYQNSSWDLRYAAEDARAAEDIIARHIEASGEFDEVHTVSLITERDKSGAMVGVATREALLAVLDALAGETNNDELLRLIPGAASLKRARPDDLVYITFSGHGLSGDNGLFHLFLSDIGKGEKREVNSTLLARTLDSDLLARRLRRVDAGDFVMVVDACNSAASVEGGGFKPGPMGSRSLGQLAYDKAMRVLAASQAEAVALESDRLRHGLLTFAMLREGLVGGAADRAPADSTIGFSELLSYGVDRVPVLYEDILDGSFAPQGRGLTAAFLPSGHDTMTPSTQRPSLFDFSRNKREVRLPVMGQID